MGGLVVLMLALCALIAWYAARDGFQVDVSKGVTVFFGLTTLLFLTLWTVDGWRAERRFAVLLEVTRGVAAQSVRAGMEVDATIATLADLTSDADSVRAAVRRVDAPR